MDYRTLFDAVRGRLDALGVECRISEHKPATARAVARAEAKMGVRLPAGLREFYRTAGNGFLLSWEADAEDFNQPSGFLSVPELAELAGEYAANRNYFLLTPEQAEKYGFPHAEDPALALRTAARMWHWLPIWREVNGDSVCIDLGDPGCAVVYDKHDWFDGGPGDNGHVLAPDWESFLEAWGGVCYQNPLWWPDCFRSGGGVDWGSALFRDPYRLATPAARG